MTSSGHPSGTRTIQAHRRPDDPVAGEGRTATEQVGTLKRTVAKSKEDRITLTAAGVAFYWFLAAFPLLIAGVGILALIQGESLIDGVRRGIESTLPGGAASVLTDALDNAGSSTSGGLVAVAVGLGIALFSASSGMAAVQEGLDEAYDVPESRGFVRKRAVGLLLTLVALLLGGVATAALVFGRPIGDGLSGLVSLGDAFAPLWTALRWAVTLAAVMALFALFYRWGPRKEPPTKWLSIGAVVATAIWLLASVGFSLYVSNFGGTYAETYGSLAGVVVLLLWLFLSALALLIGAELNAVVEERRAADATPERPAEPGAEPTRRTA